MNTQSLDKSTTAGPQRLERLRNRRTLVPATDIFESGDSIVLAVDMPGVGPEGINILLEKNVLTLEGNVETEGQKQNAPAYVEYQPADYRRTFALSAEIDRDHIEAKMKDGVLRLTLPKAASAKARKIAVQGG